MDRTAWDAVTRQYLAGELSLRLARLQVAAADRKNSEALKSLRVEAEMLPSWALGCVVSRALEVAEEICSESLDRGDWLAFNSQLAMCSDLFEFGVCAGLMRD